MLKAFGNTNTVKLNTYLIKNPTSVKKIGDSGRALSASPRLALPIAAAMVLFGAIATTSASVQAAEPSYDQLVVQARAGEPQPLLSWMEHYQHQLDANQRADWLQIANWAGRDQLVITLWADFSPAQRRTMPERGVLAVARSYRNLQQWQSALALWQEILQRHPQQTDARAGWIMSLADAGQDVQARLAAEQFVQEQPGDVSYQVFFYVTEGKGNGWDQLFALTRLQDLQANDPTFDLDPRLMPLLAAKQVSLPALESAQRHASNESQLRGVELDQVAELVRMAHTDSRGEQDQHLIADRALARYDYLLKMWQEKAESEPNNKELQADILRALLDRLGAALARQHYQEVIENYEVLVQEGEAIPDFAKRWAASAYLSTRQPEQAYHILQRLFAERARAQLPVEDAQEYFFSALESERLGEAERITTEIRENAPYYRYVHGSNMPQPNDNWLSGQVLYGHYLQKTNRLDAAALHNAKLSAGGPSNQGLRINLAETQLARNLPRAAEHELKVAEALEPTNLVLERQQAYVAQRLQEWQQFDLLVDDVLTRSASSAASQQLGRAHHIENLSELRVGGAKGISSDNPVSGSHDLNVNMAWYGPRAYEYWRPFIGFDYGAGRFDEGPASVRVQSLGAEFSSRDNWAELELSNHNARGDNQTGARVSYWHDVDDHWRFGTELERLARNTPLRAIGDGVSANQASGFVRWYENERRQYQLSLSASDFSDHNHRFNAGITGQERWLSWPYFTLDVLPSLSMSSNSQQDGLYYSPKRDLSLAPSLFGDHVLYRHYDQVWRQQFVLGAGYYWQQDYAGGLSTTVGYGQRYASHGVFDMGAMLLWNKQPYDGKREHDLSLLFDVNYKF